MTSRARRFAVTALTRYCHDVVSSVRWCRPAVPPALTSPAWTRLAVGRTCLVLLLAFVATTSCLDTQSSSNSPSAPAPPPPVPPEPPLAGPELPRLYIDTTYIPPSGQIITVAAGEDFQAALDIAQPGDIIELEAGATFTGNFILPNKTGTEWIYIQSSAYASLPLPGTRVTPDDATFMPKIVTPGFNLPAITTEPGAHHYRFVGVEIKPGTGVFVTNLVQLGTTETSIDELPHNIIFDRTYLHGDPVKGTRRGIAMNAQTLAVVDSYLSDFKEVGADSQAIAGWNGPGPFKIVNDYLEGAGENVMFGGADPAILDLVPSDIEIRLNHFYKPLSWKQDDPSYAGTAWTIKNLFELKNARRVLIKGNVFEQNWAAAQSGTAILFKSTNQGGGYGDWSVVEDVTFTRNTVRQSASAIKIARNSSTDKKVSRIDIYNNLFDDIDETKWGGDGRFLQIFGESENILVDHNTVFQSGEIILVEGGPHNNFIFRNNIVPREPYGVKGTGTAEGTDTLDGFFPAWVFEKNVIPKADAPIYPTDNWYPALLDDVDFVDWAGGDYHLAPSSPYKNAATDGKDIGADIDAIEAATSEGEAVSTSVAAGPVILTVTTVIARPDTTPPSVSITFPTPGTTVSGTADFGVSGTDDLEVTMTAYHLDGFLIAVFNPPAMSLSWDSTTVEDGLYTLTVTASDAAGNSADASVSFTVLNQPDTTPPVISSVSTSGITQTSAAISWTTDEPSGSHVEYGLTTAYTNSITLDTNLVTSHSVTLANLPADTLYHFRVNSKDAAGNLAASGDFIFSTAR